MPELRIVDDSELGYPRISVARKTGGESFSLDNRALPVSLLSFWQWSTSNLAGNTMRGCLAEYIVAIALGLTDGVRKDWEAYDLQFNRWKVEVKASGYLQSWFQKRLSQPAFSIRPARKWDALTNQMTGELRRHADLYVFCLHDHRIKQTLNPLNLDQWMFFVVPTTRFEDQKRYKHAKTIGLKSLLTLKPRVVRFSELQQCVVEVMTHFDGA